MYTYIYKYICIYINIYTFILYALPQSCCCDIFIHVYICVYDMHTRARPAVLRENCSCVCLSRVPKNGSCHICVHKTSMLRCNTYQIHYTYCTYHCVRVHAHECMHKCLMKSIFIYIHTHIFACRSILTQTHKSIQQHSRVGCELYDP